MTVVGNYRIIEKGMLMFLYIDVNCDILKKSKNYIELSWGLYVIPGMGEEVNDSGMVKSLLEA